MKSRVAEHPALSREQDLVVGQAHQCCSRATAIDSGALHTAGCVLLPLQKLSELSVKAERSFCKQNLSSYSTQELLYCPTQADWLGFTKGALLPLHMSWLPPGTQWAGMLPSQQTPTAPSLENSSKSKSKMMLVGTAGEIAQLCTSTRHH